MDSLISIIVPIYNVEQYFGECLDSLFTQTYHKIEYVFVNDATPDKSMQVLDEYIKKYSISNSCLIINSPKNQGLAATRIKGIKAAHGDYFMFCDSDDFISSNAVESMLFCAINEDADIVETNMQYNMDDGFKILKREKKTEVQDYLYELISFKAAPSLMGKLYKKELFEDVDDLFLKGKDFIEDTYASPLLYSKAKKISNLDEVTYYYRTNNMTSHSHGAKWQKIEDLVFAVNKLEKIFCKDDNSVYCDAVNEAKYRIKSIYYPAYSPEDRLKISKLFPEIDNYVRSKSIRERTLWYLIRHNNFLFYRVERKILNMVGKL
jgi:glycosyltransferase involved in cell wall biosynthesis